MSFILDALKKLEQEKAARKGGNINISDEIVRENRQVVRKASRSVPVSAVLVAVGLMLLLGASGAFFWHKHGDVEQAKAAVRGSERTLSAPVEMVSNSQAAEIARQEAPPVRPLAEVAVEPSPLPVEITRKTRRAQHEGQMQAKQDFTARPTQPAVEVSGSGGTGLTVSGIAWQELPAARRAVINGELVQEGAQVGSATVEEILPTRVRFSSGGRRFAISISGPVVVK